MTEREKHILIIPSWYPTDGQPNYGIFFKEQAKALNAGGADVSVIYPDIKGLREINLRLLRKFSFRTALNYEEGVKTLRYYGVNLYPGNKKKQAEAWVSRAVNLVGKYIDKFGKPDLIHAHCALWGGYAGMLASNMFNVPYVVTEHSTSYARGLIENWHIPYIKDAYKGAKEIIAVSTPFSEILSQYIDEDKNISVIPNLVDIDFFSVPEEKRSLDPFVFLDVALLTPKKGVDILIRAFSEAFKDNPGVILKIGGDGQQREELEKLAKELGVSERVIFLGSLSRQQVREAMQSSNVFTLPSLFETFGVVLIEALSTGIPVIATKCGGPEDIVAPSIGLLVEKGNVSELSKAMIKMYETYSSYDPLLIRNYVENKFSSRAVVKTLFEIYNRV